MNAFVQSVKYGQTPKLEEANHLGIAGTVDILEHAINLLNGANVMDKKVEKNESAKRSPRVERSRGSRISSSSSKRRERVAEFTPPASSSLPMEEEVETEAASRPQQGDSEPQTPQAMQSHLVMSPVQKLIAYFKKPKWVVCAIFVSIIVLLPV